ncbi:hypothetical protein [Absidia glauca]|uniref:Uncharacterized protein n=1 Tax=Absidia glauca TaxID=4829 RepID=A0A168S6E7_ABSGL|nr:hypothetical protein [Absidia glauca]
MCDIKQWSSRRHRSRHRYRRRHRRSGSKKDEKYVSHGKQEMNRMLRRGALPLSSSFVVRLSSSFVYRRRSRRRRRS